MTDLYVQKIFEKIKNIPKFWWILLAIVIVGIFLRTWHHHDWLRFNADQGRDAQIVSDVIDGKAALPLLGPKAGGTEFRLGPRFLLVRNCRGQDFRQRSRQDGLSGSSDGSLVYSAPFLFSSQIFRKKISLSLTAIFAVSAYAVRYARFGWNPNSLPFWAILFLLPFRNFFRKENRKFWWSLAAGWRLALEFSFIPLFWPFFRRPRLLFLDIFLSRTGNF